MYAELVNLQISKSTATKILVSNVGGSPLRFLTVGVWQNFQRFYPNGPVENMNRANKITGLPPTVPKN